MAKYGDYPRFVKSINVKCDEMLYYQYLPIKLIDQTEPVLEARLQCFKELIGTVCCDYVANYGLTKYVKSYVYLTAKVMFNKCNRAGWHSDGYLTNDINYIYSNHSPTIFNCSKFVLTPDDQISLREMEEQAKPENNYSYPDNSLLCLTQYNIHKCPEKTEPRIRTFVKVSFSKDRYDLKGNSHNYLLDYDWEMRERGVDRNVPQSLAVADLTN